MTSSTSLKDSWAELARAIEGLASTGRMDVRENGEWLADLSPARCELQHNGKNMLVHLWSEQRNLTRRILALAELSENRIVLEIQRFGQARPGKLELLLPESQRPPARLAREQFRAALRRILAERFPDAEIESSTTARDLEHSFSDVYVRGRMREGARVWAFLAASASESAAAIEGMLTFGLLWLEHLRNRAAARPIEGLRLFVPEGSSHGLLRRLAVLSSPTRTAVFEISPDGGEIHAASPDGAGNFESRVISRRETDAAIAAASDALAKVCMLVPEAGNAIQPRAVSPREVEFCFRGLRFARWVLGRGLIFGLGEKEQPLSDDSEPAFERLIRKLELHRSPLAEVTSHPLYRGYPERWLETLICEDPTRLDAHLDPRFIYSQIPAVAGHDQRVLDLLAVTLQGRLVVIEVKASENIHLPMQALDYWLRARSHHFAGDFKRLGYFPGIELSPDPPLVWLVAPALRFHPSIEIVLKYLSSDVRVTRIGVNETWRRGIKVVFRK